MGDPMAVTRKARFEVWPDGSDAYISLHNDEREAIEVAQSLPPGTHTIRIRGEVYLEVTVEGAGLSRVNIDGVSYIKASALSFRVNGVERDVVLPVEEGDRITISYNGALIGSMVA